MSSQVWSLVSSLGTLPGTARAATGLFASPSLVFPDCCLTVLVISILERSYNSPFNLWHFIEQRECYPDRNGEIRSKLGLSQANQAIYTIHLVWRSKNRIKVGMCQWRRHIKWHGWHLWFSDVSSSYKAHTRVMLERRKNVSSPVTDV